MVTQPGTQADAASATDQLPPLWEFVAPGAFVAPQSSSEQIVRRWDAFKRLFQRNYAVDESPFKAESELQRLPAELLQNLTGPMDWSGAVTALEDALNGWTGRGAEPRVVFVVGPPWNGNTEILRAWTAARQAPCVEAPTYTDILQQKREGVQIPEVDDQPWVLPELERCYLRHAEGLDLVRHFLERAMRGDYGPGIIGCDSWAWAYLQHVWPVQCFSVLTLQAFDGARLTRLLRRLSVAQVSTPYCFKNAGNGQTVMCAEDDADSQVSSAMVQLAVRTRGNAGLALHYWREALRSEPEEAHEERIDKGGRDSAEGCTHTVWVAPLSSSPAIPEDTSDNIALILHTLLLHRGLPEGLLPDLLPISHAHIVAILLRLQGQGIVEEREHLWFIAPLAYVRVYAYLRERNYLIDEVGG